MSTSCETAWGHAGLRPFDYPVIGEARHSDFEPAARDIEAELAAAHVAGVSEGHARALADAETAIAAEREAIAQALRQFSCDREIYFKSVEREVIELALGIARKVLHREAQLDPLMLAGAVRVALGKLTESTAVQLRVHPSRFDQWKQWVASHDLAPRPEVVADDALKPDACALNSALGNVDLCCESQLKEIERGLLDLLAQRPGAQS